MNSITSPSTDANRRRSNLTKTAVYYAAFITLGLCTASFGPTMPGLAEQTRAHLNEISFLFTARSFGYLLGAFLGGRLYDRVRGNTLMALALLAMTTGLLLVPLIPLLALLTAVLLLLGVAEGTLDVGANTLIVWVHREKVGPFMNGLHFFFGAGAFLSPIIIAQIMLLSGGITWAYWAVGLLFLPVVVALLRLPQVHAPHKHADAPAAVVDNPLVALIVIFFILYVSAEVTFGGWIFTYAVKMNLADTTTAAYLTSTFWGSLTLGRLISIPIAARFAPRAIVAVDLLGCLVSIAVVMLGASSLTLVWIGTFGLGLSMASIFPITLALAERRMTITGRVNGWFFAGASIGSMFLPWFVGQLFESAGPTITVTLVLLDLILTTAVFAILMLYTRRPAKRTDLQPG